MSNLPSFDPSSMSWDEPAGEQAAASDLTGVRVNDTGADDPTQQLRDRPFRDRRRPLSRPSRLGTVALVITIAGATASSAFAWFALGAINLSDDPLGSSPSWLAASAVAVGVTTFGVVLGLFAVVRRRARWAGAWAIVTGLVLAPLLMTATVSSGVGALKDRAQQQVRGGVDEGLQRVTSALEQAGVPSGPLKELLGEGRSRDTGAG